MVNLLLRKQVTVRHGQCSRIMKTQISNLVRTTRFWNNRNQVRSRSTDWKANLI